MTDHAPPPGAEGDNWTPSPWYVRLAAATLRSWKTIVLCLPALVVGIGALGVGVAASSVTHLDLAERYSQEAERSERGKRYERAELCAERLTRLVPGSEEYRFRLARILEAREDLQKSDSLLMPLAPLDRAGYPQAQIVVATRLMRGPFGLREARDAEAHLRHALETEPNNSQAHVLLGFLYERTGRPDEAEPHLKRVVDRRPDALPLLIRSYAALRLDSQVTVWAEIAEKTFRQQTDDNPDDTQARLNWASARVYLKDFAGAVRVLEEGQARAKGEAIYRSALSATFLNWAEWLAKEHPDNLGGRLTLLERGLRLNPSNPALLDQFQKALAGRPAEAEATREKLRSLLSTGQAAPSLHFLLGNDAFKRGRTAEARFHWEQALKLAPEFAAVANNLAWLTVDERPDEAEQALALTNSALERLPDIPSNRIPRGHILGTRGHILIRLKRWKEALTDLQAGLPTSPEEPAVHRDMAEVYEALGMPEMARTFRNRAEKLAAASVAPNLRTSESPKPQPVPVRPAVER
jgi:tetratricopeptide (TPR) repeat protein